MRENGGKIIKKILKNQLCVVLFHYHQQILLLCSLNWNFHSLISLSLSQQQRKHCRQLLNVNEFEFCTSFFPFFRALSSHLSTSIIKVFVQDFYFIFNRRLLPSKNKKRRENMRWGLLKFFIKFNRDVLKEFPTQFSSQQKWIGFCEKL